MKLSIINEKVTERLKKIKLKNELEKKKNSFSLPKINSITVQKIKNQNIFDEKDFNEMKNSLDESDPQINNIDFKRFLK